MSRREKAVWLRELDIQYKSPPKVQTLEEKRAKDRDYHAKHRKEIISYKREWVRKRRAAGLDPWYERYKAAAKARRDKGTVNLRAKVRAHKLSPPLS